MALNLSNISCQAFNAAAEPFKSLMAEFRRAVDSATDVRVRIRKSDGWYQVNLSLIEIIAVQRGPEACAHPALFCVRFL